LQSIIKKSVAEAENVSSFGKEKKELKESSTIFSSLW